MSEQEFEVYLKLIAKLLRLSEAQREAIADELRDHMEARLEELMAQGLDREQAIHAAVEEFGDAAGLADQFSRITRQHTLRRRIMRTSIGALAAASLIALTFLYMLPQNRPGVSGPTLTHAEDAVSADRLPDAPVITAGERDPARKQFTQRIPVAFDENSLEDVFDYFRDTTGVNVFVNWSALEAGGADIDTLISLTLNDTPAETALSLVLQLLNPSANHSGEVFDFAVIDGVVVISSKADIDGLRVVRIYDCIDLIDRVRQSASAQRQDGFGAGPYGAAGGYGRAMGGDGGEGSGYGDARGMGRASSAKPYTTHEEELMELMRILLDDFNDGSVSFYDDMLIVIASHKTHQRIQETLVLLRRAQLSRR